MNLENKKYSNLSELLIFCCIVFAALLIRLIYLNQIKTNPFFVPFYHGLDDYLYDSWAQKIAAGNVLGTEVFYGLPLYPYFLGFLYFLFGHNVFMAKAVQLFIGSVNCGLIYLIGSRVFSRSVGIIASVIMVFYAMAIFFESLFVSTFLAVFLNCVVILILLSAKEKPHWFKWMIAGVLIGISSLANASVLVFSLFVVYWIYKTFKEKAAAKRASIVIFLFAGIFLAIAPVTVRNYIVSKDFVPVTAHSGITFYAGNNPLSDGSFKMPREIGTSVVDSRKNAAIIAQRISGKKLKPSEVSSFWFRQGTMFIKNEPQKYIALAFRKIFLFWNAYEVPDILPLAFFKRYSFLLRLPLFSYGLVLPFALFGMLLCARERRGDILLIYFFIFSIFLSTVIYFVNSRYRIIAVPYLCLFSAVAVRYLYEKIKDRKFNALVMPTALMVTLLIITHIRILDFGLAQSHNNLGIILKRKGLYDEAINEYKKAIEMDPRYDSPYFNLGLLYFEQRKYDEAIKFFNGALKINPKFIKAHNYLGEAYARTGRRQKALFHWRESLKLDPDQPLLRKLTAK